MLSAIITLALVGAFAVMIVLFWVVQARRVRMQRVVLDGGVLSTSDSITSGALKGIPVENIGTVVYLPERRLLPAEGTNGIWTWGGILVLDTKGKLAARIVHIPGSDLPLSSIYEQIPAARHDRFEANGSGPYRRAAFLRQYPNSLGAFELRGATWLAFVITTVVCFGIPLLVIVGAFIGAVVTALASYTS